MTIKNDYIIIKTGKKKYELKNYILTNYLRQFAAYQTDNDYIGFTKAIDDIFLKFEGNGELPAINENTVLLPEDFDVQIETSPSITTDIKGQSVTINYDFNINATELKNYVGNKIIAIGFRATNNDPVKSDRLCAVVDTSNYEIYIEKDSDFNICRRDIITTNAQFWSPYQKIKGPIHLSPNGMDKILTSDSTDNCNAIIYSVGFGTYINHMEFEYIIGEDVGLETDNELAGVAENEILISSFYFTKADDVQLYLNSKLYPSSNLYPLETNMKLLIIKYKIWQKVVNNNTATNADTGLYYHVAIPYDVPYQHNLRIKYERG